MKKILTLTALFALLQLSCSKSEGSFADGPVGTGGSLARFAIIGNTMFTAEPSKLMRFDITNVQPVKVTELNVWYFLETLYPRDENTLFAGTRNGMAIYNTAGNGLQEISFYQHMVSCDPVVANATHAYVTMNDIGFTGNRCNRGVNRMDILNIEDLHNIIPLNQMPMKKPIGLGLFNNVLFVCNDGIEAYDITIPHQPFLITAYREIDAVDVIVSSNSLIVRETTGITQMKFENNSFSILSKI